MNEKLKEKINESLSGVLPITVIVLILSITLVPMEIGTVALFLVGALLLIVGMGFFQMGAEMSVTPLGRGIGTKIMHVKILTFILAICFVMGFIITVAEPDLQVLANQVASIPNSVLIYTVAAGVGVFLVIAFLRIKFKVPLSRILTVFYIAVFVISFFAPNEFTAVAFDSGGVTTGPMTVPFIMSLGAGVSASKMSSADNRDDSFGITGLCSIGPIIAVLVLGIALGVDGGSYTPSVMEEIADTREGALLYFDKFLHYAWEVILALTPIVVFAVLFQLTTRAFNKVQIIRMSVGVLYVLVGLAVFLAGANVGFVPTGTAIGTSLATMMNGLPLIFVSMLLGYFIVKAEPSVYVLNKLVETMSAGSSYDIGIATPIGQKCCYCHFICSIHRSSSRAPSSQTIVGDTERRESLIIHLAEGQR